MRRPSMILLQFFIVLYFVLAILLNLNMRDEQHFSYMADSFLQGRLHFVEKPGNWYDTTMHNGKVYLPHGPGPVIMLLPFFAIFKTIGIFFYQGYLQIFLTTTVFFLSYKLAVLNKYKREDALWLAFAFVFSSTYMFIAFVPSLWNFAHAVAVFFLFLAISEWYGKKRHWMIGIYFAFVAASRFTAVFGLLFFIADLLFRHKRLPRVEVLSKIGQLIAPVVVSGVGLLWYNLIRFGNPFDNGYMAINNWTMPIARRFETLNYGLFQLRNIPMNIYYYFFKTLDPVRVEYVNDFGQTYVLKPPYIKLGYPGTSFFVGAPIFLYMFYGIRKRFNRREIRLSLLPVIVILCFLLPYYWPGWRQIGPRYTLDFLPFAYLILLHSFDKNKLTAFAKVIIVFGALLNFYLFYYAVKTPI